MGNAGLGQVLVDSQLSGHDHVVGGGEHSVHIGGDESGSGGHNLVVGIGGLLHVLDALAVQIGLGVSNGLGGVGLGQGVQQAHLGHIGVLGKHHVHDEFGVQCVAGAGDIVDAGEAGGLGVGNGGIDNGGLGLLCGEGGDLGGGGGDGDDGVHAVGDGLVGKLLQGALVVLAGGNVIFNGDAVISGDLVQLGGRGVGDLVQGGVVQLLDDGHLVGLGFGVGGFGGALVIRGIGGSFGLAAAGGQGQRHGTGKGQGQEFLHYVALFHLGFLQNNIECLSGR